RGHLRARPALRRRGERHRRGDHRRGPRAHGAHRRDDADPDLPRNLRRPGEHDAHHRPDLHADRPEARSRLRLVRNHVPDVHADGPAAAPARPAADDYEGCVSAEREHGAHLPRGRALCGDERAAARRHVLLPTLGHLAARNREMSGIETSPRLPLPGVIYTRPSESERYLREGAWRPTTIGNALRQVAHAHPQRTAYVCDGRRISFAEVDEKSSRLAAALQALGLRPGDRAIFQMGTGIETALALFGCFKAGILPVCTIPQYRSVEISALAAATRPSAFFVQADVSPNFDQVAFAARMAEAHGMKHLLVARGHTGSPGRAIEALIAQHAPQAPQ